MKLTLKGMRSHNRLLISGITKAMKKDIPPYFTITIDTDTIQPREKEKEFRGVRRIGGKEAKA